MHSASVIKFHPLRQPSQRLRALSGRYDVAADCFIAACDSGCSGDIADRLYAILERERAALERREGAHG
jgi:hypothetical protein